MQQLTVVIDQASLETTRVNGKFEIITPDHHQAAINKLGKNVDEFRPEILHNCLLMLLDSPLNREERLKIYIRTKKNIIIEINNKTRIPRTFNRFCGLMAQLMQKFKLTADDNETVLMRIIPAPLNAYFPNNAVIIGISKDRDSYCDLHDIIPKKDANPIVAVIAATEAQDVMQSCSEFVTKVVSLSNYDMTSEMACLKLCRVALEKWVNPQ